MKIGQNWTDNERAEIEGLCQQNREAFLRIDFLLGVVRPLETMSTRDILFLVRLQIERMNRGIDEVEAMLRCD